MTATDEKAVLWAELPQDTVDRSELLDGVRYEKMPTLLHGWLVQLITAALHNYMLRQPLGWVIVEGRYRLAGDEANSVIPDVSVVLKREGRTLTREGAAPYLPDLAVEVQSPSQSDWYMAQKARYYLAHGVAMVWLVYPDKRIVEVLMPSDRQLLTAADTLGGGALLPDFALPVQELFRELES